MSTPANADLQSGAPAPEKKRTLFDTVLTSTPVLLTVVATFMVGQSSGEMTRAQYHRSVAGQNQSKVADQWAFFQAKRIRGTTYEVSADTLAVTREPVALSKEGLAAAARRLADEGDAVAKVAGAKATPGGPRQDATDLANAARTLQQCLDKGLSAGGKEFAPEQVAAAFATLKEYIATRLPTPLGEGKGAEKKDAADKKTPAEADDAQKQLLYDAVKAINDRKPENELAALVIKIDEKTLHDAIADADAEAKRVADKGKKAENVLEQLDLLVDNLAYAARKFLRSQDALPRSTGDRADPKAKEAADAVRAEIDRLTADYKTARHQFTKNRYERDARSNQRSAELYEVGVHLSGARSDRHLERSKNFMYAMLVAQVGVIIASMALAVKQKSAVWLLATLAGLVAIGFGGYVFLGMN